jgi:hypothetical protein
MGHSTPTEVTIEIRPMNLRTIKKLSKRASPLLRMLGDDSEHFPAEKGERYLGSVVCDRKHWELGRSTNDEIIGERMTKRPTANGDAWIWMRPPTHARKGTIMVGGMTEGQEPEWVETDAYEALCRYVFVTGSEWTGDGPVNSPDMSSPSKVFIAAETLIESRSHIERGAAA